MSFTHHVLDPATLTLAVVPPLSSSKHGHTVGPDEVCFGNPAAYAYWEPNHAVCNVLTVDMDQHDAESCLAVACAAESVPLPDYYIVNDEKGTVQASWMISPFPSYLLRHDSRVGWLYRRVLESLRTHLHGDPCFTDGRRRNPYCGFFQRVMVSDAMGVHSLDTLRDWLESHHSFDDGEHAKSSAALVRAAYDSQGIAMDSDAGMVGASPTVHHEGSRNNAVFLAAVKAARHGGDALAAAHAVSCVPPLPESEIRNCARSASRCASRPAPVSSSRSSGAGSMASVAAQAVRETCAQWGRRGGRADTPRQRESRSMNLSRGRRMTALKHVMMRDRVIGFLRVHGAAGLRFLAAGGAFVASSISSLARRVGCSRQTVKRCLDEVREMLLRYGAGQCMVMFRAMRRVKGYVAAVAVLMNGVDGDGSFMGMLRSSRWSLWDYGDIALSGASLSLGSALPLMERVVED